MSLIRRRRTSLRSINRLSLHSNRANRISTTVNTSLRSSSSRSLTLQFSRFVGKLRAGTADGSIRTFCPDWFCPVYVLPPYQYLNDENLLMVFTLGLGSGRWGIKGGMTGLKLGAPNIYGNLKLFNGKCVILSGSYCLSKKVIRWQILSITRVNFAEYGE